MKRGTVENKLPDVQSQSENRNIKLHRVGVENIVLPFSLLSKNTNKIVPIQGNISLGVDLPKDIKGTHMSRFIELIERYSNASIEKDNNSYFGGVKIYEFLNELKNNLDANDAYLNMDFIYFIEKKAPVSKKVGRLDYKCKFEGILKDNEFNFYITVEVPIMNVCPCSKEISLYGAHNQRGYVTLRVKSPINSFYWIEDIVGIVEKNGSAEIYSVLKREDEKYITERSYENPKFVEDVSRDIAVSLSEEGIIEYEMLVKTIESIHNHEAFAYISSNIERKLL